MVAELRDLRCHSALSIVNLFAAVQQEKFTGSQLLNSGDSFNLLKAVDCLLSLTCILPQVTAT